MSTNNISELSVFFPAYNEEQNIKTTLQKAEEVLKTLNLKNYEMIVVNDGSKDKTGQIVAEMQSQNPHIRLVDHPINKGYGGALKTGFNESKYEWVAFADSDGQFDFGEITKMIEKVDQADLVLGYRLNRADSTVRKITTLGWSMIARVLLGLSVKDYSCGFKLINKKVYNAILPLVGEEKVTQIEMFVKAKRQGFRFAEVGVHHYPRVYGQQTGANLRVVLKSIKDLFKLWWLMR